MSLESKTQKIIDNFKTLRKRLILDGVLIGLISGSLTVMYRFMLTYLSNLRLYFFKNLHPLIIILCFAFFG